MTQPQTCVIIVNYKGAADTSACVESLVASDVPVHIVVVDNTPNDPQLEAALGDKINTKVIYASENLGFGRANNLGMRWVIENLELEYIYLLNNDATVMKNTIRILETKMSINGDAGILAARIAYMEQPSVLWYGGGEIDWRRGSAVTPGINGDVQGRIAMTERDVTFITGCSMFIRKSVLMKIGGFDPRFFMYEEDVELCLRAKENGIRMRYVPEALVLHRCQGSLKRASESYQDMWDVINPRLPFYVYHSIRNRFLNIHLHAKGADVFVCAAFFPLYLLRRAVPFIVAWRWDAIHAMAKAAKAFWRDRKKGFIDEIFERTDYESGKESTTC